MKIEIHTKSGCGWCDAAKAYLNGAGCEGRYEVILHDDPDERAAFYDSLGLVGKDRTMPQIIVDGARVGGCLDLFRSDVVARLRAERAEPA